MSVNQPDGTWDPTAPSPAPSLPALLTALFEPEMLATLAEALGGGQYPGMGSGQNDTMPLVDSVAPGFPLNLQFLIAANQVKLQAVKLSFQPQAFRTYYSATQHTHAGDTVANENVHTHAGDQNSTNTITLNGDSTVESVGHIHRWYQTSGQVTTSPTTTPPNLGKWLEGKVYDSSGNWVNNGNLAAIDNDDANIHTTDLYTDLDSRLPSDHYHNHFHTQGSGHTHTPTTTGTGLVHTHTPGTTGANNPASGVQEGTSPDAMHVLVDGTDVTTQLGGPFSSAQTELDITPYVAGGTGLHTVQVTTATNLGRITGFVRHKSIVNNLSRLA